MSILAPKIFKECLRDVYCSEQAGEVTFEALLQGAKNDEERYMLGSFLQMETEAKVLMRPVLMKMGISILDDPDAHAKGMVGIRELNEMPWELRFDVMAKVTTKRFLPKYEELATLIHADDDTESFELAVFLGDHERALIEAFENIAAGRPNPIEPIISLLKYPISRPA